MDFDLHASLEHDSQWNLWQTGVALYYGPILVFKIWELPFQANAATHPFRNSNNRFKLKLDGIWSDVNLAASSILEIYFPLLSLHISQESDEEVPQKLAELQPNMSVIAKLLALTVDHIDLLLEDWYPSLGTRFVHTSEGRFLITRMVMCPKCLKKLMNNSSDKADGGRNDDANETASGSSQLKTKSNNKKSFFLHGDGNDDAALNVFSAYLNATNNIRERRSEDSCSDADSAFDSAGSSRNTSVDGHPLYNRIPDISNVCYAWMIEECILSVYNKSKLNCPIHLEVQMQRLAPDVIFADIPEKYSIPSESIVKGSMLGRGAFGFVFKATCKLKGSRNFKAVAMKMLQPVPPGPRARDVSLSFIKL